MFHTFLKTPDVFEKVLDRDFVQMCWNSLGNDHLRHFSSQNLHSLKLTACPWKWMVGIRSFSLGIAYFQVRLLLVSGRVHTIIFWIIVPLPVDSPNSHLLGARWRPEIKIATGRVLFVEVLVEPSKLKNIISLRSHTRFLNLNFWDTSKIDILKTTTFRASPTHHTSLQPLPLGSTHQGQRHYCHRGVPRKNQLRHPGCWVIDYISWISFHFCLSNVCLLNHALVFRNPPNTWWVGVWNP